MKKLLLLSSFLFISFAGLNAQNDFRKLNWGESSEVLMKKNLEVDFLKETEMGMTAYSHISYVSGLKTRIAYCFINDVFMAGLYQFTPERASYLSKDFVKDFDDVSSKLNSKYKMEREDVWYQDNSNVDIMGVDFYLKQGDVDLNESSFFEGTFIIHSLANSEGIISHSLMYASPELLEQLQSSSEDDF